MRTICRHLSEIEVVSPCKSLLTCASGSSQDGIQTLGNSQYPEPNPLLWSNVSQSRSVNQRTAAAALQIALCLGQSSAWCSYERINMSRSQKRDELCLPESSIRLHGTENIFVCHGSFCSGERNM